MLRARSAARTTTSSSTTASNSRASPAACRYLGHVLAGYGTDPQGEIQQAAFQAGFVRDNGFMFLLFGILQFHVGMRITPIAKSYEGLFDVPRVLEALRRGAACKVEVRAELGVPPLVPFAKAS